MIIKTVQSRSFEHQSLDAQRDSKRSICNALTRVAAATLVGTALVAASHGNAFAQQAAPSNSASSGTAVNLIPDAPVQVADAGGTPAPQSSTCDPYKNYSCLDDYLGSGVFERLYNYYRLEWGEAGPPTDPNAGPTRRDGWPTTPETSPPMPFTEWPYGGTEPLGVTTPNSYDSPLMVSIANTGIGKWMFDNHLQFYGWVDPGINVSSNNQRPGGNYPIAYIYTPNTVQLDQIVLYLDRWPDMVQSDHIDWGMRISGIYGENYRYTTAYGIASYQLLNHNQVNGYDFPMEWFELFVPQIGEGGTLFRVGRFISVPDIEAQLAPNNYMYTHSLTYAYDNYTNEGLVSIIGITKKLFLTLGIVTGTEAPPWHLGEKINNLFVLDGLNAGFGAGVDPLYPNKTMLKDPGVKPSGTACLRYQTQDGTNDFNICADGINSGHWGYNNLQWYGFTYYHKFNDHWHLSYENYWEHTNDVPNINNAQAAYIYANGGTPFSPQYMPFNAPGMVYCPKHDNNKLDCTANSMGAVMYLNYSPEPLDNISLRPEVYADPNGWRSGNKTTYVEVSLGWQHWLSPQIEIRPEVGWYVSLDGDAFNGDANAGIAPTKNHTLVAASDIIAHF